MSSVLSKLTWFGGVYLAIIAILPMLIRFVPGVDLAFGGTSILIVVGVALETIRQLESQLVMRQLQRILRIVTPHGTHIFGHKRYVYQ